MLFSGAEGFAGIELLSIDFFNLDPNKVKDPSVMIFREAVAEWYYIIRLIATAILLVVLIYVGIRMALSTIASEQAKYKKMLVDWVTSLALLFLLHYIIIFVIQLNQALINGLDDLLTSTLTVAGTADASGSQLTAGGQFVAILQDRIFGVTDNVQGMFCAIVFLIYIGESIIFLIFYIQRMITVGFLIMIAPLITITYAIDKMGDGKAQALNAWLKEIIFTILIQPFHCILYCAFFGTVSKLLAQDLDGLHIMPYILAIFITLFLFKAEKILKKIFNFQSHSMGSPLESAAGFAAAAGKFAPLGAAVGAGGIKMAKGAVGLAGKGTKGIGNAMTNHGLKKQLTKGDNAAFNSFMADRGGAKNASSADIKAFLKTSDGQKARSQYYKTTRRFAAKARIGSWTGARAHSERKIQNEMEKTEYKKDNGEKVSYEDVKKAAKGGTVAGLSQSKAIEMLSKSRSDAEAKVAKDGPTKISKARGAVKKFANSKAGKATGKVIKNMSSLSAGIAGAALGAGLGGGKFTQIAAGYQLGSGMAKGAMTNTTKSLVKEATAINQKVFSTQGIPKDQAAKHLHDVYVNGEHNEYDNIDKKLDKFLDELTRRLGDSDKAKQFVNDMKLGIADKDRDFDLNALVNSLNISDPAKKQEVFKLAQESAGEYGDSLVYNEMKKAESAGVDIDDFIDDLVNRIENTEINNITTQVEVHNENNVHQTINVEGGADSQAQQQATTFGQDMANNTPTPEPQTNFDSGSADG